MNTIGEKITYTSDFTVDAAVLANENRTLRFGIYDSVTTDGYFFGIDTGTPVTTTAIISEDATGAVIIGGSPLSTVVSSSDPDLVVDTDDRFIVTLELEVTNTAEITATANFFRNGILEGTLTGVDTTPLTTFDRYSIRVGDTSTVAVVDPATRLTYIIPEPSVFGLIGLGGLALIFRRRRG
ncbi:MAG: PEP-CTERM sorting domain-containing protein [Verrucomicrobiota bacterium]